mgnify:CR=1 FL=1|tara:strand:+ start:27 stop:326 length:300 start_codon:yes stop_codon:yes gene_type:complete
MKLTKLELTGLALFILFLVYLYYNPLKTTVYETQPVYYPVYKTQYVPVSRPRRYPVYPRPRHFPLPHSGHHNGHHPHPHPHPSPPPTPHPADWSGGGIV